MKKINKINLIFLIPTLLLGLTACSSQNNNTVAEYGNNKKISQEQFYQELRKSPSSKTVLANLLIYDALNAKYGKKLSTKKINNEYKETKERYGNQFNDFLEQNSYSPASFKRMLKINSLSQIALHDQMKPNQAQLKKAWSTYRPTVKVQHVLTSSKATANNVIDKLKKGASFSKLAEQYSIDNTTSIHGGKMSITTTNNRHLDANIKHAAYTLKVGQFNSSPIKTASGYEIIKVLSRPSKGNFNSRQAELTKLVYEQWATNPTIMRNVISQVLKEEKVTIKDKDLDTALDEYKGKPTSALN